MKKDVVIKVEGIGKKYAIGSRESYLTLRDRLMELPRKLFKKEKPKEFWALKNVSFEIKRGEVVGIIGRNGAGKSTLLKILARITEPTTGRVTMRGRVASMLEVGTGFNPELTGRENIYLNGAILGMAKREIESKFEEIVEFSGVDKFLDTPVKHYSSGMYVRLAFAVAAHLDSDILLVDEVLAVGDAEFQKKCLGKMSDLASVGRTVIFVSHNLGLVKQLCTRILHFEKGEIRKYNPNNLVDYSQSNKQKSITDITGRIDRKGSQILKFIDISIIQHGKKVSTVDNSKPISIVLKYESISNYENILIALGIDGTFGQRMSTISNELLNKQVSCKKGTNTISFQLDKLPLITGDYSITLFSSVKQDIADWIQRAIIFSVNGKDYYISGKEYFDQGEYLLDYKVNI